MLRLDSGRVDMIKKWIIVMVLCFSLALVSCNIAEPVSSGSTTGNPIYAQLVSADVHTYGAKIYGLENQAIPNLELTELVLEGISFDADNVTSDSSYICAEDGYYFIHGQVNLSALADGNSSFLHLYKNGVGLITNNIKTGGAGSVILPCFTLDYLYIDDVITCMTLHNYGSTRDTLAGSQYTFLEVIKVAD